MNYKDILSSDYFFDTYSKIEFMKRNYPVNHGFVHIWHVINNCKYLSKLFNLDNHELELLLIAASLHDIGYLLGRDNHAYNGSILAKDYLNNKLNGNDIDIICNAIKNHGGKEDSEYLDKISLCLILADKFDFTKTRYREDSNHTSIDLFMSIEKVELKEINNAYELEIITSNLDLFSNMETISFFNKLKNVLEKLELATKKSVTINIKN